ncbi:MAG TPA: alginate export family protein [Chitinophagaceae bacterium]|nr:alginate export family protein [Chitinophagaceae bacterium]
MARRMTKDKWSGEMVSFVITSKINQADLRCTFLRSTTIFLFVSLLFFSKNVQAQIKDSLKTGFLLDAAEEYWPAHQPGEQKDFSDKINHIPIRDGKGFISTGGYFREVYEYYDNHLWGRGPQDNNGYFLHRAIVHADFRYNKNIRAFVQAQSSFLSGRNGGARPVDLDKLAIDQIFGEYSFHSKSKNLYSFRFGKQTLNYGVGSLLDIRETNVRRSFFGAKFIAEHKNTKVDLFAMELIKTNPGFFDDKIDPSQKIAGIWMTQTFPHKLFNRLDAYYLYTRRDSVKFAQGLGTEGRHTFGAGLNFLKHSWRGNTEVDAQFGKFNGHSILAWKLIQTLTYQFNNVFLKPALSVQSALSSGDNNLGDSALNTFNPIYPKAIYYGYIDNIESANLFLMHFKIEVEPAKKLKLTSGYYTFWRQSIADGLYAPNGSLLVAPASDQRRVGSMLDVVLLYAYNSHFSLTGIVTYFKRGPFLEQDPTTPHDTRYLGITATLRL